MADGMSPDEIANAHDLTLVQVYAALTYAFEHIDDIHRDIQQSDRVVEEIKSSIPPNWITVGIMAEIRFLG